MLVVLSDLHLTDASTAVNVPAGAFSILEQEILSTIKARQAKEIHLVLLGDILDLVRTDYWHRKTQSGEIPVDKRPWNGTLDPATAINSDPGVETQFKEVLAGILQSPSAKELLAVIQRLKPATPQLRVTYVIGNHDRILHNFPSLKAAIAAKLPGIELRFASRVRESLYGVIARHGHEWDENCHGWRFHNEVLERGKPTGQFDEATYRVMAIGEVVTAELMSGLIFRVREAIGGGADAAGAQLVEQLKDLNNLRPMLRVFEWLDWIADKSTEKFYPALHKALKESLDGVIQSGLARRWDELKSHLLPATGDLIDHLEDIRKFALGKNFKDFRGRVHALTSIGDLVGGAGGKDEYLEGAARELRQEEDPAFQYVFYGHTHVAKHEYLSGDRRGRGRIYVNTGTYLPLITHALDGKNFASAKQMTMAFVYSAEEDTDNKAEGLSLDVWNGIRRKLYGAV